DVPVDRLEWLARRADVPSTHLAAYVQAHRLADDRMIKPQSFYAFLRAGLPADLLGLLRAGERAWTNAMRGAWAERRLPLPGDGSATAQEAELTETLAVMRELVVDAELVRLVAGVSQQALLDTAGLSESHQRTFAQLWLTHEGPIDEFWTVAAASSLASEVPQLKFTVQAATLVGAHLPTLAALQAERNDVTITELADTAAWSIAQWDAMLVNRRVTPPDDIPGADAETVRQTYARTLFNVLESAYPSASLGAALTR
ncbi:hypothetical protein, partial [Enhygromyxa salina]|uniref:hypothetical protein n=1 Tax=Enhygromyxa salina TaxID=215803 RepID=UPI0015E6A17B